MIYPYKHRFLLFNDIVEHLTGYVRMIEFRCFAGDCDFDIAGPLDANDMVDHAGGDPTVENSEQENWILGIMEGDFKRGQPHGFCRRVDAFNGLCQMGYFKEGRAWGKYCEYGLID